MQLNKKDETLFPLLMHTTQRADFKMKAGPTPYHVTLCQYVNLLVHIFSLFAEEKNNNKNPIGNYTSQLLSDLVQCILNR